ncbi:MAG TPA: hypothetical protein V6C81_19560 [Planktothrix sp.]
MDSTRTPVFAGGYGNFNGLFGSDQPASPKPVQPWAGREQSRSPLRTHPFRPRAELLTDSPIILMTPAAYQKQCVYIDLAPKEVGWMGTVKLLPSGNFLIEDTYLLEQQVSAVETELSKDGIERLSIELIENYPDGVEMVNKMRFWGHSHVFMGTSPSGTDESTMTRMGADGTGINWYIRGIFNKLGRAEFTLYLYDLGYRINDAPWAVLDPKTGRVIETNMKTLFSKVLAPKKQGLTIDPKPSPATSSGAEKAAGSSETQSSRSGDNQEKGSSEKATDRPESKETSAAIDGADSDKKQPVDAAKPDPKPAPKRNIFAGLPELLTPSAQLRQAIKQEYKLKVKENRSWFEKETEDEEEAGESDAGETTEDGEISPATSGATDGVTAAQSTPGAAERDELSDADCPIMVGKRGDDKTEELPISERVMRTLRKIFS